MTGFEVFSLANILIIWALSITLFYVVGKMKYSFYKCFARSIFHKDHEYIQWLLKNKYYIYCIIIAYALIFISLGLLSQLYNGMVRIRQESTIMASILVWGLFIPLVLSLYYRATQNEKIG